MSDKPWITHGTDLSQCSVRAIESRTLQVRREHSSGVNGSQTSLRQQKQWDTHGTILSHCIRSLLNQLKSADFELVMSDSMAASRLGCR